MKNVLIIASSILLAPLSFGTMAYACDMHGAGYGGYGLRNATWQAYSPRVSKTDPAFAETDMISPMTPPAVPPVKAKPSFSNVANIAATKAKARLAKKQNDEKLSNEAKVKKTALNADR